MDKEPMDWKSEVYKVLEDHGVISKFKAQLKTSVALALKGKTNELSPQNKFVSELKDRPKYRQTLSLIYDSLQALHLTNCSAMFIPDTQENDLLSRDELITSFIQEPEREEYKSGEFSNIPIITYLLEHQNTQIQKIEPEQEHSTISSKSKRSQGTNRNLNQQSDLHEEQKDDNEEEEEDSKEFDDEDEIDAEMKKPSNDSIAISLLTDSVLEGEVSLQAGSSSMLKNKGKLLEDESFDSFDDDKDDVLNDVQEEDEESRKSSLEDKSEEKKDLEESDDEGWGFDDDDKQTTAKSNKSNASPPQNEHRNDRDNLASSFESESEDKAPGALHSQQKTDSRQEDSQSEEKDSDRNDFDDFDDSDDSDEGAFGAIIPKQADRIVADTDERNSSQKNVLDTERSESEKSAVESEDGRSEGQPKDGQAEGSDFDEFGDSEDQKESGQSKEDDDDDFHDDDEDEDGGTFVTAGGRSSVERKQETKPESDHKPEQDDEDDFESNDYLSSLTQPSAKRTGRLGKGRLASRAKAKK
ncbi:hypothetical protein BLNAU_4683 [Blattamonas nauphoetae]|uniref:Uncharacterized protein n=1 Tax=Blattamonas nauphoetae TaxID=2049346 RepID=A0ABQ9Y9Q4_9EUKA|nr:hypothetical protein BLNAU_4683 [Blattamonas nauphoetae]